MVQLKVSNIEIEAIAINAIIILGFLSIPQFLLTKKHQFMSHYIYALVFFESDFLGAPLSSIEPYRGEFTLIWSMSLI
jgi:hypothetical protein